MQILEAIKGSSSNHVKKKIAHLEVISSNISENQQYLSKKKVRWQDQMISKRHIRKRQVKLKQTATVNDESEDQLCALEKLLSNLKPHEGVNIANQQWDKIGEEKQSLEAWCTKHQVVLDSGATSSFMRPQDRAIPTREPSKKRVGMPDGTIIQDTKETILPMTQLLKETRQCDILPGLQHNSLCSFGKLADARYYTIFMSGSEGVQVFDAEESKITVSGDAVLIGWRDIHDLWQVPVGDESKANISLTR